MECVTDRRVTGWRQAGRLRLYKMMTARPYWVARLARMNCGHRHHSREAADRCLLRWRPGGSRKMGSVQQRGGTPSKVHTVRHWQRGGRRADREPYQRQRPAVIPVQPCQPLTQTPPLAGVPLERRLDRGAVRTGPFHADRDEPVGAQSLQHVGGSSVTGV